MSIREQREQLERQTLSKYAAFSDSATRRGAIDLDSVRTAFTRDRDRILHTKAFRRLMHKTQVFVAPQSEHYRTRLTHTLEVSQISRTIARALNLNEDLTEAVAMGHDLGHTPFGHTGEDALSFSLAKYQGLDPDTNKHLFKHNVQSLRIVDVLANDGVGLNLTDEVRDGIVHHTGCDKARTLEGRIVATADRIAYVNHDIDDALRAKLIVEQDLPMTTHVVLGESHSERISTLVNDMISSSHGQEDILMSAEVWDAMMELRRFLFKNVYQGSDAKAEGPKAFALVVELFNYYIAHIDQVPQEYIALSNGRDEVAVCDYIASMTDHYATQTFERLFVPDSWRV